MRGKGAHLMTRVVLEQTRAAVTWSSSRWGRGQIDGPGCQASDAPGRCGGPERPRCARGLRLNNFGLWDSTRAFGSRRRDLARRTWDFLVRNRTSWTSKAGRRCPNPDTGPWCRRSRTGDEKHDSWLVGREAENQGRRRSGADVWKTREGKARRGGRKLTRSCS